MNVHELFLHRSRRVTLACLLLCALLPAAVRSQNQTSLPPIVLTELKRLDETYRVLDAVSSSIWPGWNDYRKVPFLFEYENGLKVLIGHPNPPKEFQLVNGALVGDSRVFADTTQLSPKELVPPLAAGGGPTTFGSTPGGDLIRVVAMKFAPADQLDIGAENTAPSAEQQMLIYIHELFHCFQNSKLKSRTYGNLQFNADATYSLYSEIEGLALHRAYLEPNDEKAKLLVKQFLVARELKRAATMTDLQADQQSADEFAEGTATYAEVKTLETLKGINFTPSLDAQQDPMYSGFRNIDSLLRGYQDRLLRAAADVEYPYGKSYTYGCFQSILSDRLLPEWKSSLDAESPFIDRELQKRIAIEPDERQQLEQTIKRDYPIEEIRRRNARYLTARDAAYRTMKRRSGYVYVIDFKATGQYLETVVDKKGSYSLGFIQLYPNGLGPTQFDDVRLSRVKGPAEINQLYYIRTIDGIKRKAAQRLVVNGRKELDGSWKNATVQTPLFTLKAPHVRIKTTSNLIKIQVLSRVNGQH